MSETTCSLEFKRLSAEFWLFAVLLLSLLILASVALCAPISVLTAWSGAKAAIGYGSSLLFVLLTAFGGLDRCEERYSSLGEKV